MVTSVQSYEAALEAEAINNSGEEDVEDGFEGNADEHMSEEHEDDQD